MPLITRLAFSFWFAALLVVPCAAKDMRPITPRDLATLADLQGLAVSPDGKLTAFQERWADPDADNYKIVWKIVPTDGGAARITADAGDPIQPIRLGRVNGSILPPPPVWSPDGKWIAYLKKENGRTQIWRARIDGKHTEQLTKGPSDVRALAWPEDGARLLFETEPGAGEIAAALAEEGRGGFLYDQRFFPSYSTHPLLPKDVDFGRADGKLPSGEQEKARRLFAYDFARKRIRPATDEEFSEFEVLTKAPKIEGNDHVRDDVLVGASGGRAWIEARDPNARGGMAPVTVMAEVNGAPVPCAVKECMGQSVALLAWRHDSELLFLRREGIAFVERVLYAWKPGEASVREVLRTEDLFLDSEWKCAMGSAKDDERLICFYEEKDRPRRLVAIDPDSGKVETLYDPNPDFVSFALGAKPERIDIRTESGIETYGYLVLPPDYDKEASGLLPLIVVTYRCHGFLRGGTGDEYPVYPFAAAGFAVLCFNVPDTDHEKLKTMDWDSYQTWSRGPGDPEKRQVQKGLETSVAQLVDRGLADPKHVAVTGLSFGAETVSYALFNMDIAAAIASGAEIGPASPFLYGPASRANLKKWGLADPWSDRWKSLSITHNADKVRGALLLNVADRELMSRLHPYHALDDAGRAVEMYVFPDEYHIKWRPAHRLAIYNRNLDWLNFWLRGVESGLTGDPEQYTRWRAMRDNQCRLFGPNGTERTANEDPPWYCRPGALDAAAPH